MGILLDGKHVVVTGSSGGLGPAVVEVFTRAGATVHAPSRKELDAGDERAVTSYFAALPPLWASVHVVGGFLWRPLEDTTLADLKAQLDVNLISAFLCTREAGRKLKASGGGRIVNVASHAGEAPGAGVAAYASSKAAVIGLTRAAAVELKPHGVLVNAVAPTIFDTPANRKAMPDADFSTWARPEQIAEAILWLCSTENTLTTGARVPVG